MTKSKTKSISSLMHLFITISVFIVAAGLVIGLLCQFLGNGYFAYGDDYASYKQVTVEYAFIDINSEFGEDEVKELCVKAFNDQGIAYYTETTADTTVGGSVTFKFADKVDGEKVSAAVNAIKEMLNEQTVDSDLTSVTFSTTKTLLGGEYSLSMMAIAVAVAIVLQFIYFVIRYRLTMALAAVLADIHNLAIFVSLVTIVRVPVSSSICMFGAFTVVLTMAATIVLFNRMKRGLADPNVQELSAFERVDSASKESIVPIVVLNAVLVIAVVLAAVVSMLGSMQIALLTPLVMAVLACVATLYGTVLFIPSVYSRFLDRAEKIKNTKKAPKAPKEKSKRVTQTEPVESK